MFLGTTFQIDNPLALSVIADKADIADIKQVYGKFSETQSDLHANIWKRFLY